MFTGIIEAQAKIKEIQDGRFVLENPFKEELHIGQSIAHDGACMTLESIAEGSYSFFAMEESLKKTNFWEKKVGDSFNVERSMKIWERIDGHFVTGHVDTRGIVKHIEKKQDSSLILWVSFPEHFSLYTIEKGSISLNGTSLTIVEKLPGYISVSLIPLTQDWTNLGKVQIGDTLNIEFDMLGKYVLQKV